MYHKLDLEKWNRLEHFKFFSQFDEPIYGITADINVTDLYRHCKIQNISFYLSYMHLIIQAVNEIEVLKYRIQDNEVLIYDKINVSATVIREDESFGFSYIEFDPHFTVFEENAKAEIERIQNTTQLFPYRHGDDVIHFSALPWISFTSLSHARNFKSKDSVPKISVGKVQTINGIRTMPLSIHVHHGLVDGIDLGKFFVLVQKLMSTSPT